MAVIDGVFCLTHVWYTCKRETLSVVTLEWSEIIGSYNTPDAIVRDMRIIFRSWNIASFHTDVRPWFSEEPGSDVGRRPKEEVTKMRYCCSVVCSGHLADDTRTALYQQLKDADGRKWIYISSDCNTGIEFSIPASGLKKFAMTLKLVDRKIATFFEANVFNM